MVKKLKKGRKNNNRNNRKRKVAELYNQGKSVKEIENTLGIPRCTIYSYIKELKTEGKIKNIESNKKSEIKERREKIIELYNQGKTVLEMTEILGRSQTTIRSDIRTLKATGKIKAGKNKKEEKLTQRRERIIEIYNQGKSIKEISDMFGVSTSTTYRDINDMIFEGKIEERKSSVEIEKDKRREQVGKLYNQGKSISEIANLLGIKKETAKLDICNLIAKGKVSRKNHKENDKQQTLEEINEEYKEALSRIRKCIRNGEISEALDQINKIKANIIWIDKKQREKLIQLEDIIKKEILSGKGRITKRQMQEFKLNQLSQEDNKSPEELYYNMMKEKIERYIEIGAYSIALQYINAAKKELGNKLTGNKKENFDRIEAILIDKQDSIER